MQVVTGSFNKVLCAGAADMASLDEALAYAAEAGVLIGARLADAAAAGCDLVCSQTDPVTVSQHNMERAGLRMAYTKVEFHPIA